MSVINRAPVGWLGFLGIKNFGRNPQNASDTLAPTWDISGLYMAQSRIWINSGQVISGLGAFIAFTPQAGQVWYVHAFGMKTNALAAGNTCNGCLSIRDQALGVTVPITEPVAASPPVGASLALAMRSPIILAANQSLSYDVTEFTGANISMILKICYTQLDA